MNCKRSFESRGSRSGLTIVEIMIVMALFSVLMTTLFFIFQMGLSAWHKADTKNELLQQVQVANLRIEGDVELSSISSLSTVTLSGGKGIAAFLTPLTVDGDFIMNNAGKPEWQAYLVYYLKGSDQTLYRRRIELNSGDREKKIPTPLENYKFMGGSTHPLVYYTTGGTPVPVAHYIKAFEPEALPAPISQLTWRLDAERKRYGSERPELVSSDVAAHLRN